MTRPLVTVSNFAQIPPKRGLKDGGHVVLSCSACGEPLVDLWVVRPDAVNPATGKVFEWRVVALCCYCGDRSFEQTVRGRYALGPWGVDVPNPDPDGMNDSKLKTAVTRVETRGDVLYFHTKKRE